MDIDEREATLATLLEFFYDFPGMYKSRKKNSATKGSADWQIEITERISNAMGRPVAVPEARTIPDPIVWLILETKYELEPSRKSQVEQEHQMAMNAENIVGNLLEEYIHSVGRSFGWVKCFGETVEATDFLKKGAGKWLLYQIKNRDNSENSSSKKARKVVKDREGLEIEMWFRCKARTGETNWANFPDQILRSHLSESGFREFVKDWAKT